MAGFTWDDVKSAVDASQAASIRSEPPATYKVPQREWKDPGVAGAFMQGVDRFAGNLADGIVQARAAMSGDEAVLRGLKGLREPENAYYKQTQQARPWATGFGEAAPYALVPGGPLASALGVAGVEGLSYGTAGERAKNAALGGGLALGAGWAGQKVGGMIRGGGGPANVPTREAVQAADRLGVPLTVGQRTGADSLLRIEDSLARAPGSSGLFARTIDQQQRAVNRGVGAALGATDDGGKLTQSVVANARDAAGAERAALKASSALDTADPAIVGVAQRASERINALLPNLKADALAEIDKNSAVKDLIAGIVSKQKFSGEEYQQLRTALKNAADAAFKADKSAVGNFYKTLVSGLDDIAQGGQKEAWKASDVKFATLKLLEDTTHVWNPATGNVSGKNFANRFSQVYGAAAKEGRLPGQANDVLLATKGVAGFGEGSQTAGRQLFSGPAEALVMGPARYAAGKALNSQALSRAAGLPARWLSEGMWPGSPAAQQLAALGAQQLTKGGAAGSLLGLEGPYLTSVGLLGR